jgi:ElaB/YqjD/DUF883 family membrane-anchored ribosome-binding protein
VEDELDVIRNQMEETRASLAGKLEALEDQLKGTVEGATHTVSDTVESVKETVETVKETFNLSRHVQRRPWLMVGGAVAVGYLGGCLVLPKRRKAAGSKRAALPPASVGSPTPVTNGHNGHNGHRRNGAKQQVARGEPSRTTPPLRLKPPREEGPLQEALKKLSGLAVGGLMGVVRRMVNQVMPEAYASDATRLVDQVTTKLGGQPLPKEREPEMAYSHPRSKGTGFHG